MRYSKHIKPFTFLSEHAERLPEMLEEIGEPIILTRGGEAKAVVLSVHEFERMQDELALQGILNVAEQEIAQGKTRPAREEIEEIRQKLHASYAAQQAAE